jgi:hypothetical protein
MHVGDKWRKIGKCPHYVLLDLFTKLSPLPKYLSFVLLWHDVVAIGLLNCLRSDACRAPWNKDGCNSLTEFTAKLAANSGSRLTGLGQFEVRN